MHVLRNMVDAVRPDGLVLDLQVIPPNPAVEVEGRVVYEIDGEPLFTDADAATAAVDDLVRSGALIEEAIDDHDVREHYTDGADLVATWQTKRRQLPHDELPALRALTRACAVRERCRLRRLRVLHDRAALVRLGGADS